MSPKFSFIYFFLIFFSYLNCFAQLDEDSLKGAETYVASDKYYLEFKKKFPKIQLYVKGSLTSAQQRMFSQLTLKTFIDNYSTLFIEKSVAKAIVVHKNSSEYCQRYYAGRPCKPIAGWAATNSGVLNVIAATEALSSASVRSENIDPDNCDDNASCTAIKFYIMQERQVVHHEFFHSIDVDPQSESWAQLSPSGWKPTGGLASTTFNFKILGFISEYAATAVVEDRAETFSHMITSPAQVISKSKSDSYVKSKILAVKSYLQNICGQDITCEIPKVFEDYQAVEEKTQPAQTDEESLEDSD
jgi:hypothetical protein